MTKAGLHVYFVVYVTDAWVGDRAIPRFGHSDIEMDIVHTFMTVEGISSFDILPCTFL